MIDAHSLSSNICDKDAFCTLRIFPRSGRIAWNSELRAALVVPSADSPSTKKSSVRFTSSERQSANLVGSDEDSSAFLRRCNSLCVRVAIRVREAFTIFSSTNLPLALSIRFVVLKNALRPSETTLPTILIAAFVPRTSLVWPSNCG